MNNQMTIPTTITVGCQERKDTYTGQLAYVVYTDEKGVLRKEKSWNDWRDKSIEPKTFDNIPTSGFVLNKKVGETRWGWNPRKAWVRVYDPRGFEFEISVSNLLFILEECTSTKGKGLEGEFVYSWDGKDLVLLPVCSEEYKSSVKFTDLKTKKISKKDLHDGWTYQLKDLRKAIYVGYENWFELDKYGHQLNYNIIKNKNCDKKHIFYDIEKNIFFDENINKIALIESNECCSNYADLFEEFKNSKNGTVISDFEYERYIPQYNERSEKICLECYKKIFVKINGECYNCGTTTYSGKEFLVYSNEEPKFDNNMLIVKYPNKLNTTKRNAWGIMQSNTLNNDEDKYFNVVDLKSHDDFEFYTIKIKIGNTFITI